MTNTVQPQVDGPLTFSGEIEILRNDGTVVARTVEIDLCRCGKSANKPFCDGSHAKAGFRDEAHIGAYQPKVLDAGTPGAQLRITLKPNGPLRCFGEMQICDAPDLVKWAGGQASLCRCGGSKNKPFCDGSHRERGFVAD